HVGADVKAGLRARNESFAPPCGGGPETLSHFVYAQRLSGILVPKLQLGHAPPGSEAPASQGGGALRVGGPGDFSVREITNRRRARDDSGLPREAWSFAQAGALATGPSLSVEGPLCERRRRGMFIVCV